MTHLLKIINNRLTVFIIRPFNWIANLIDLSGHKYSLCINQLYLTVLHPDEILG